MEPPTALRTERLILRRWREADREPYAALNADPVVMERLPTVLTRDESDAMVDRIEASFDERGFGLWAVEVVDGPACIGFVGLSRPGFDAHFTPAVEVGWRLAQEALGSGLRDRGRSCGHRRRLHTGRPRRDRVVHVTRARAIARASWNGSG